jgi:DNA polymerase-4
MILHIDMDAFYASVEERDNPEVRGHCVIIGGLSGRGVVASANYAARKFGVHSAMPVFQARQRCPRAVFIAPRMSRYREVSEEVISIFREYSPLVEQVSIDEAYVDVTGCERLWGSPPVIARLIKDRIRDTLRLTCSVGVAPNKFLAKIASDMEKPDGLVVISPEDVPAFVATLPVRKVPGVGHKTENLLKKLGIRVLGDLEKYSEKDLIRALGSFGRRLKILAGGIDTSPVIPHHDAKSVSAEETLRHDTRDTAVLKHHMLRQAAEVGRELRALNVRTRTITLKIKYADFTQVTRSATVSSPTQSSHDMYQEAVKLLAGSSLKREVRLIGLGASNLVPESVPVQMELFEDAIAAPTSRETLEKAVDYLTDKYGTEIITQATLKDPTRNR